MIPPPERPISGDRWFHDEHGELAVWQLPNPPLVVWLVARFLGIFVHHGRSARLVDVVAFGALFTWSWLELFDGAAYVRRLLGLVVLLAVVAARVR